MRVQSRALVQALILLLTLQMGLLQAHEKSALPPAFIFGTWRIYRFEEVGGHALEKIELAETQIGKIFRLDRKAFRHDKNFLWFTEHLCSNASYRVERHRFREYDGIEKGTLRFYGLGTARRTETIRVIVFCDSRIVGRFELDNENHLAVYYDGWFFFLERDVN